MGLLRGELLSGLVYASTELRTPGAEKLGILMWHLQQHASKQYMQWQMEQIKLCFLVDVDQTCAECERQLTR